MIYIEEKIFDRQVDLLDYFRSHGEFDLIIWLFPESKTRNICDLKLAPKDLIEGQQVTKYEGGFKPRKTRRVKLTSDLLIKIRKSSNVIKSNCDSLVLYPPNEKEWIVCTIEHEGMCLVNDDSLFKKLDSEGFNPSLEKPEWW